MERSDLLANMSALTLNDYDYEYNNFRCNLVNDKSYAGSGYNAHDITVFLTVKYNGCNVHKLYKYVIWESSMVKLVERKFYISFLTNVNLVRHFEIKFSNSDTNYRFALVLNYNDNNTFECSQPDILCHYRSIESLLSYVAELSCRFFNIEPLIPFNRFSNPCNIIC
jgi:hypothetical protein